MVLSAVLAGAGVINPATGQAFKVKNLLLGDGLVMMLTIFVKNFEAFPPYILAIVVLLGVGVAEECGYLSAMMLATMLRAPHYLLTFVVIFVGSWGTSPPHRHNHYSPLGAMVFQFAQRNPIDELLAGYIGCTIGLTANLLIVGCDSRGPHSKGGGGGQSGFFQVSHTCLNG